MGTTPDTLAALLANCLFGTEQRRFAAPGGGGGGAEPLATAVETAVLNGTGETLAGKLRALPPFSRLCVLRATLTSLPREALFTRLAVAADGTPPWTLLMDGAPPAPSSLLLLPVPTRGLLRPRA